MMGPWMMGQDHQQQNYTPDLIVPARVRMAMEFLGMLTHKTMSRAAVSDIGIEVLPGQQLCDEEVATQATACNLLSRYFAGKLTPDCWEKLRYDAMKQRAQHGGREGIIIRCISCGHGPMPNPSCELCKGSGKVFVSGFLQAGIQDIMAQQGMMPADEPGDDSEG
jgi:hypothetical protein